MKNLITTCLLLLLSPLVFAQTAGIKGVVMNDENAPIFGASISIKNTTIGTQTDESGQFILTNLKEGNYVIAVLHVGYVSIERTISVQPGQTLDMGNVTLLVDNKVLNEVVVEGDRSNIFAGSETPYVAKLPLKELENAQVYSTINTELLQSQVVTNFDDAIKNATGVDQLWASTGRGGDGTGYYTLRGFSVQPKLINGLPGLTNGRIHPANIERIEVIKGPSATLFGNAVSSYGGLINVVTKRSYEGDGGSLSYTTGSFGLNEFAGDVNTGISRKQNAFVRLNAAYTSADSWQDAGFSKSYFVAPSLLYKPTDKLTFNIYGEISGGEQTNPTFLFLNRAAPSEASNLDDLGYNNKLSFTSNNLSIKNPSQQYGAEMQYKISSNWTSQTLVASSSTATKGYYSYLYDLGLLADNTFSRFISKQNATTSTKTVQQNFIGDTEFGRMRNRLVIGLDYFTSTQTNNSTGYVFYGNIKANGETNGDSPYTPDVEDVSYPLSAAGVDKALAGSTVGNSQSRHNIYSAYASDVLNITPAFAVMAGIRVDKFDNEGNLSTETDDYNQVAFSPKFGVVFQPLQDQLSVFANYQNGFTNVAPQLVGNPDNGPQTLKTFKPEQADQLEFGLKSNLISNRLNGTVSYYHILVKDRVITDPSSPFNKIQGGEVMSKGIEIELNANPVEGLNIRAGYSHNISETTKSDNANILNKRPLDAGPSDMYNLWANYKFGNGALNGFGLGLGLNGASERYAMNYASTGEFILPAYTVLNASLFYQSAHYAITLKMNNALNETYYKGWSTINPQDPRSILARFTFRF